MIKSLSLILILVSLLFTSCIKEGCTNAFALNFNKEAEKDNGTCHYEGRITFYFDQIQAVHMASNGATEVNFYIDNDFSGRLSIDEFHDGTPNCEAQNALTITEYFSDPTAHFKLLKLKDQNDDLILSSSVYFSGGECLIEKIDF